MEWRLFVALVTLVTEGSNFLVHAQGECPEPCICETTQLWKPSPGGDAVIVDCRKRNLTTIPDLSSLQYQYIYRIYLDYNRITSITGNPFQDIYLHGLQLADNPLTEIATGALSGLAENLEYLSLTRTELTSLPSEFLGDFNRLNTLDLGGVSSEAFKTITDKTFGDLPFLEDLILRQCGISSISVDAFEGLPMVTSLKLDGNQLTSVPEAISSLTNLADLELQRNAINQITASHFRPLDKLEFLNLYGNSLGAASSLDGVFSHVGSNLKELNLNMNRLTYASKAIFDGLEKLEILYLADNRIDATESGTFGDFEKLHTLDLSSNPLNVTAELFQGIQNTLTTIGLRGKQMTEIPLDALKHVTHLSNLDIGGNKFGVLKDGAFSGLPLRVLSMPYCQISSIEDSAFEGLPLNLHLDLNKNKLTSLSFIQDPCAFDKVELFGLKINCDCALYEVVRHEKVEFVGKCASPDVMKSVVIGSESYLVISEQVCGNKTEAFQPVKCPAPHHLTDGSMTYTYSITRHLVAIVCLTLFYCVFSH